MPNTPIDLADIPIIDHHAHALIKADVPLTMDDYRNFFTESPDPVMAARYVPDSIMWQWGMRELAALLKCEPTSEAVFAARSQKPLTEFANTVWTQTNSELLIIDYYGYDVDRNYTPEDLRTFFNQKIERVLRLETFAQDLILRHDTFTQFIDAYRSGVERARDNGHVGLKSIIAYRTGLNIDPVTRDEAARAFGLVKDEAHRSGTCRLATKPLNDYIVLTALEIADKQGLPVQFHTGLGDTDLDMRTANPLCLRYVLEHESYRNVPFVLLHASYPFVRELGYLAAMYPHVFMDISLAIPFITTLIPHMIHEALGLTPISKIMYSSDAFSIPEIYYLANRWGRAGLERVLGEIVDAGALTVDEALRAGRMILNENARRVYGLA